MTPVYIMNTALSLWLRRKPRWVLRGENFFTVKPEEPKFFSERFRLRRSQQLFTVLLRSNETILKCAGQFEFPFTTIKDVFSWIAGISTCQTMATCPSGARHHFTNTSPDRKRCLTFPWQKSASLRGLISNP